MSTMNLGPARDPSSRAVAGRAAYVILHNTSEVVTPDAEMSLAVEGALFSGFGTAGQRCTSLGTVIASASDSSRMDASRDGAGSPR